MNRKHKLNGSNEICRSVDKSLDEYFQKLDGESATGVYDMVVTNQRGERAILDDVLEHRDDLRAELDLRRRLISYWRLCDRSPDSLTSFLHRLPIRDKNSRVAICRGQARMWGCLWLASLSETP